MILATTFALLFESALRAALLGVCVWAFLWVARVRDVQAEIMIWTAVLVASIGMPLLSQALPGGITVPLPSLSIAARSALGGGLDVHSQTIVPGFAFAPVLATPMSMVLWSFYGVVVAISLARLTTGLILTLRLYRNAHPIAAPWAVGRAIRASAKVSSPISFGTCILLPADCCQWSESKRRAVLAHEQSHIRRGDFFIQLFAALHRAVFWFSPFAWWLQQRLCALAEAASDEAAVRVLNDRTYYAEILIDVSHCAHAVPAQVAMAKGPNIHWRVDRILGEVPERSLSLAVRFLAVSAIVPAAWFWAGAHASVVPPHFLTRIAVNAPAAPNTATPAARPPLAPTVVRRTAKTSAGHPRVQYNPRALLEDDDVVGVKALLPTNRMSAKKKNGEAAVILNMNSLSTD